MLNTPIWEPPKWRDPVTKQGFCGSFFLVLGGWDYCFVLPSADLWVQWVLQQQWLVSGIGGCPSHFETKLFLVIDPFLLAKCRLEAAVVGPNQNQDVKGYKAKALFTSRLEVVLNIWIDFIGRLSTMHTFDYWSLRSSCDWRLAFWQPDLTMSSRTGTTGNHRLRDTR